MLLSERSVSASGLRLQEPLSKHQRWRQGGMLGILFMLVVLHSSRISIVGGNVSQTIISLTLDAWIIVQGFNMAIAIGVLGGILPALASAKEDVAATFGR